MGPHLAALLSVLLSGDATRGAQQARSAAGVPGVTAAVRMRSPRFMVHEPVMAWLEVSVSGTAEAELFSGPPDSLGRPPRYTVELVGANGVALPVPVAPRGMADGNGISGYRPARPGTPVRESFLVGSYAQGLAPGAYRLRVSTTARARPERSGPWRELPLRAELAVVVVADDDAALTAALEALGSRALVPGDDGREAVRQLQSSTDPRALPQWLRVAQAPDYELRFGALTALGRFDDPRAVQALARALVTQPSELPSAAYSSESLRAQSAGALRNTAAQVLASSARPDALAALLAQERSTDEQVRLTVLHRAARLPAAQARPYLERGTRDSYELVRSEAQRYLREQRP